jgi:osmotically-inducible protein OsmY
MHSTRNSDETMKQINPSKTGWNHTFFRAPGRVTTLVLAALLFTGCASSTHDHRTAGNVFDDQTVEYQIIDHLYSSDQLTNQDHIKVEVHKGVVLLMGETQSEANRKLAEERAAEINYVKRVVNELTVTAPDGIAGRLENAWLSTKVNTALTTNNPIHGFDATRIKVITARNTVYLMGLVTREEADAVVEVVRNVGGVEKVIKVFEYSD